MFGAWIGWIVKTFDYITMILRVRRIFFEITTFPNNVNPSPLRYLYKPERLVLRRPITITIIPS